MCIINVKIFTDINFIYLSFTHREKYQALFHQMKFCLKLTILLRLTYYCLLAEVMNEFAGVSSVGLLISLKSIKCTGYLLCFKHHIKVLNNVEESRL